ncbi:MAG: 4Fe-4S dicluster domain-containing protein [Anaerolineaceae bacterium]|nr:4Fe-4S dicluster domain-containing protein [Anaerolineaceae bacterium]
MRIRYPVENGDTLKVLQAFLQNILSERVVDLLLVPMRTPSGTITPSLVSDPELLIYADPLAPVLPVNSATLAGQVSMRKPRPKVGAVLRSCELRALIELVKFQQASLEDMFLISVDCAGTYNVPSYLKLSAKNGTSKEYLWKELFTTAVQNPETPQDGLRKACRLCDQPVYDQGQITIELMNSDLDQEVIISLPDDLGERMGCNPVEVTQRTEIIEKLSKARLAGREAEFATMRERMEGKENITSIFSACIRCHNCMTVCPICYCKTCVFKSQVFEHEPMQYLSWAQQKGAYRMPADTMLFHLTRLNHMVLSCVGCGMCIEACPAELPVGTVFSVIGQQVQGVFNYLPGRNLDEKPPLVTFKADEWSDVGE